MLFSVFTLDNPDAADKRDTMHGAHVAHLKRAKDYGVTITVGGPLVSDDGASAIGSLMVLEAPDRASAEKFNRAVFGEKSKFDVLIAKSDYSPTNSLIAARNCFGCSSGGQWPQPGNSMYCAPATFSTICLLSAGGVAWSNSPHTTRVGTFR